MSKPLNILLVEDSPDDALLLLRELKRAGYEPLSDRVDTPEAMHASLESRTWDIIISDFLMPKFSGPAALELARKHDPDIPFLIVSGNIGEDIAVDAMRAGAHDYILKNNLKRLVPAVERELREAAGRRERKSVENQLRESRSRLFETLETMMEGFFLLDRDWHIVYLNAEAARLWNKQRDTLLGKSLWEIAPQASDSIFGTEYRRAVSEQVAVKFESLSPLINRWVEVRAYPSGNGLAVYFHDITDRKNAEEQISRLNRLYSVLSKVNEAIVRAREPEQLYELVCRILVETGQFKMAWIGMVDKETKQIRPRASYGDEGGYLKDIMIVADDVPEGRGPTGRAVVEQRNVICADFELDPSVLPWRDKAYQHGFRSSAAIPLTTGAGTVGVLTAYADTPRSFSEQETSLLSSLAEDLSFAIDAMQNEQSRRDAEQRMEVTNSLLKLFTQKYSRTEYLDAACSLIRTWTGCRNVGIRLADVDGRVPFHSSQGYTSDFLREESDLSLVHDRCICMRIIAGEPVASDFCCLTPNGSFFSNDTGGFLQDLDSGARPNYRGVCMRVGFKSLAVVPINYRGTAVGAIHIADERLNAIPEKNVLLLEHLAYIIGEAVFRFGIEDDLRENYNRLRSTSELLERIFSTTHMLVAYLDRNLNFIRVNRAYADAERHEPVFFVGRNYFDLCPDEELKPLFQQVVKTGAPHFEFERPFLYPGSHEGAVSYWDWSLLPVKEPDGAVSGLVLTLIDVTDRLKAEEGLRRAFAYNRSLIEASLDPLFTVGPDGNITDANSATEVATGHLRSELVGTAFTRYFTEPAKAEAGYRLVFREGKVMDYELELRHRSGRTIPVLFNASVYRDTNGMVLGVFAAARDVTALKKAEQERIRLASAVESTADAVVITDPDSGTIQYVNPAFEQVTGYARNEAIGRPLHLLDGGKQGTEFYERLRKTLQREGVWRGQLMSRKKDGTAYFEDCTFSPVKDSAGTIINFVAVKRDVTEKLRLESIAESVNTMNNIGYVFSGVRHEIGNPINSAKMSLSVLEHKLDAASKDVVRDYVGRALSEINRVEVLLKSLRNFNLYEKPELERFDLTVFLQKFLDLVSEDFGKKGIRLVRKDRPAAIWAKADQRALQQVLLNLITNAADALAGRPDPEIAITTSRSAGRIVLRINDNGCGMTEQQLRDLFKPFYTSKVHGTGLGLVIVKKMLNSMNADISIASVLDRGTTVDINLPEDRNGIAHA